MVAIAKQESAGMFFANATASLKELEGQLAKALDDAKAIEAKFVTEKREATKEEGERIDALLMQAEALRVSMDTEERSSRRSERLGELSQFASMSRGRQTAPSESRQPISGGAPSGAKEELAGFRSEGEFFSAIASASRPDRTRDTIDQRLIHMAPATFGAEGGGEEGGVAVIPTFGTKIEKKVQTEESLLPRTDQATIDSNELITIVDEEEAWGQNGILAFWEGENVETTASRPRLGNNRMRLSVVTALVPVTEELLEDAPSLEAHLNSTAPDAILWQVNKALVRGSGAGMPRGLLNSASKIAVAKETGQAAATIIYENISKMWSRMPQANRFRAIWLGNQDAEEQFDRLVFPNANGVAMPAYLPPGGVSATPYGTIKGRPVVFSEAASALGTEGDLILVDFSTYRTAMKKGGIKTAMSAHVWFDRRLMAFRFTMRLAGASKWQRPMTRAQGGNTLSNIITLAVRA